jgi:hypothetical protein
MIVAPHSTQSLTAFHWVVKFTHVGDGGLQQTVSKSLIISLPVMVVHILCDRVPKRLSSNAGQLRHPELSGCGVMPATCTGLEATLINNRMYA